MNAITGRDLPDIQASADLRRIAIQRVGVKGVTHPMQFATRSGPQPSVGVFDLYVALRPEVKGAHMSRFIEALDAWRAPLDILGLNALLDGMLQRLEADAGVITVKAPFFVRKSAPVSGVESYLDYQVRLTAERRDGAAILTQEVQAPVTSLCPCSKEISSYGAHNQRSHLTLTVEMAPGGRAAIEDLIDLAERSASCQLWGLLKRPDEKYVTEKAYENPKFVEDLVRDVALELSANPNFLAFEVSSENFESIHNHSAFAWLRGPQAAG